MTHDTLIAEVERWLVGETLHDPDILQMFGDLCQRLHGIGIPLERAALSWPTLHPLFQAEQIYWRLHGGAELFQYRHDAGVTETFTASPFHYMIRHKMAQLRRRLDGVDAVIDFPVLEELAADGFTDYLLTSTSFSIADVEGYRGGASGIMASWSTRRTGGFSDSDLTALTRVQRMFAVACHAAIQKRIMVNLANAYLGETAAARVLSGEVRRGDGELIRAVVWYSDLRRSTAMSNAMGPEAYLELLRAYYDCTAQAVIEEGGEVLEFIGDAVLAIFPICGDAGAPEAVRAATRAMEAALRRRETWLDAAVAEGRARAEMERELAFSVAMASGEMMFGNIGVPTRLTFSAIGAVVNKVTRLDDMTKVLGKSVLVTAEIAQVEPECWASAGPCALRDFEEPVELFYRACATDAFQPMTAIAS